MEQNEKKKDEQEKKVIEMKAPSNTRKVKLGKLAAAVPSNISGISIKSLEDQNVIEVKTGCCGIDPTTRRGKQLHLIQMLLLPFIPIMALITQNVINMVTVLHSQDSMYSTIDQVHLSTALGNVTEALQSERAEIAFYLFTNGSVIRQRLSDHFKYTNGLLDELKWPQFRIDDGLFKNKLLFQIRLDDFRDKIAKFDAPSIDTGIAFYNKANYIFLDQLTREIKEEDSSGVWRPLLAYKNILRAIEHLGISMVFGEQYFGRGELDQNSYLQFVINDALGQDFLNSSQNFAMWIKDRYMDLLETYEWYPNITRRRSEVIMRRVIEPDFVKATEYFEAMLGYLDELKAIQYEIRKVIEDTINLEVHSLNKEVMVGMTLLIVVLVISPIIILLVRMVTRTLQVFSETLLEKTQELNSEKKRSDKLLYQMIPPSWADRLRSNQEILMEIHESVTVYFGEIQDFHELIVESTPLQVITLLNSICQMYSAQMDNYDVYNIDMSGDAFMMASGLHMKCPDTNHAAEIANMALDLLEKTDQFYIQHLPREKLKIRVGVHTGGVAACAVGLKTPRFCIHGDSVSTAAALENSGEPRKIHISAETKRLLDCKFIVIPRGELNVHKNKPRMETFWLVGRHGDKDLVKSGRTEADHVTGLQGTRSRGLFKKLFCM